MSLLILVVMTSAAPELCFLGLWSFPLQAFFDKDYITSHPEDAEKITQLKDLMQEQVRHPAPPTHTHADQSNATSNYMIIHSFIF